MSNDMKTIMESWKRSIQEMIPDILDDPERAPVQAQYEPAEWFADMLKEIIPYANIPDIKPAYEKYLSVLEDNKSDSGDIAAAALAFIWIAGTTLLEFIPAKKAVSVGFELAPKIARASKKIEKAPFKINPKVRKQAAKIPFELKKKGKKTFELVGKKSKKKQEELFTIMPKESRNMFDLMY